MPKILKIFQGENIKILPTEVSNLDYQRFSEYAESSENPADIVFEDPELKETTKAIKQLSNDHPTLLKYFLDGSRRTYKVADVSYQGRYLPLIAGQIGAAVMHRDGENSAVKPFKEFCKFRNLIAFPSIIDVGDIKYLQEQLDKNLNLKFEIVQYKYDPKSDPVDKGIAKINTEMQSMEIAIVEEMADKHILTSSDFMVIDGPLRFGKLKDITQFKNVIGLSKTFRPSFTWGKGRKKQDVGSITYKLKFGERTTIFKPDNTDDKIIGMWYLRLRGEKYIQSPLQGIIKAEIFAVETKEKETGFDSDRIDTISTHLLRERNVTPFKSDNRWASHIYPIFLAESYTKSKFLSDFYFKGLFN